MPQKCNSLIPDILRDYFLSFFDLDRWAGDEQQKAAIGIAALFSRAP
jgi:hypothetical protein